MKRLPPMRLPPESFEWTEGDCWRVVAENIHRGNRDHEMWGWWRMYDRINAHRQYSRGYPTLATSAKVCVLYCLFLACEAERP